MINTISFPGLGLKFTISRTAFSIGGINIYWYGIIIAAGMILALIYGIREFRRCGLKQDDLLNMFLICVPVSIICARLYYVVFSLDQYRGDPLAVFDIRSGGIAVYGSLIGAAAVIILYCRKKRLSLGLVLDILAVGFILGQAVGRWGNFVNGEAFGRAADLPWAMTISSGKTVYAHSVHPTFLYESIWDFAGFILLLLYRKHKKFDGEVFLCYILWYGLGRFWIEGLRTDSLYLGPIRISQLIALVSAAAGAASIIWIRHRKRRGRA